ncbi:HesA/MoeB/ThiF family protein [Vibrio sp. Isolate31]|uniref:HesA/MoeB/ThiF family protein n=1 Tax=unclassified Vibrio TaxID=2614977 RepID=UPI001EFE21C0|nr:MULTISPECIES: HesA/MoeB/ThiF family protein [unclassified Vibrio]MCG9555510.1 HesA/MoeB/ThiF family protein [Vibrio sp. Isolate32]MCG9601129.1 HesA/MoeB/ThiF family protein [Vibrio sp. Isolate31]
MLSDFEFVRYQRQIALPEIGEQGQRNLLNGHVLVIGCGGLGNAAALYLAASGVGKIVLVDDDCIDSSNLQRQIAFKESDLGTAKVDALKLKLSERNGRSQVRNINKRMAESQLKLEVMLADVVLDCTDNFTTRQQVNQACFEANTPLISGSAIGWKGQFIVFDYQNQQGCYHCLFPFDHYPQITRCSDSGIIGPVVGTIGNLQALAAIQRISSGEFQVATHQLKLFDGKTMNWQNLMVMQDIECPVCNSPVTNNLEEAL